MFGPIIGGKIKKGATGRKATGPKKKPVTRSVKVGLQFPVGRIGRYLKKGRYSRRVGTGAPFYLAVEQKPSFELFGKLAEETNRVRGITLLFTEPPDARKPDIRWRLYVFKGGDVLNEPLYVHRQSCYLFGRERRVVEIPTDHPSCNKQHAVL